MLTFVASCIRRVLSTEIVVGSDGSAPKFMNMNGLNKKRYSTSKQNMTKPLLEVNDQTKDIRLRCAATFDSEASNVRVKVKMTKQEAVRLLSKCKDGGLLEFRDVARELVDLPVNRVIIVSPNSPDNNAVLYSIAEEY